MSKKDYELVAQVVYDLPHFKGEQQSHGLQRRTVALRFARAFAESNKRFDMDAFMLRAENGV